VAAYLGSAFAPIARIADHIEHVVSVGGEDCVALGSDYDGFMPLARGMRDAADLPRLTQVLWTRGWRSPALEKLLGGNALRLFRSTGPANRPRWWPGWATRPSRSVSCSSWSPHPARDIAAEDVKDHVQVKVRPFFARPKPDGSFWLRRVPEGHCCASSPAASTTPPSASRCLRGEP
jgi:hypothetical protein